MVQPYESENGWRPRHAPADLLEWITVPGTDPVVRLRFMKGWPTIVLRAFAADFNAYVEHLRDGDSAAFTPTNSVATSNHLNGTAMDLNWNGPDGKTFRLGISEAVAYPGEKAKNLRDLLDFYEEMVFCGGNWSIHDWMHFQMGGDTWNNPKTGDFILRKIRLDGYSTYRRGGVISPPPPPPPPSNAADVLARATDITLAKAQAILAQISFALTKANCTNPRRIAAALAQWVIESGHFVYTEEIADGPESQERWKYKGRTWVQLTWLENYRGFSEWCHSLGLVPAPDYFVVRPRELAEQKWAALGPAYWWAIKYPRINEYADRGDIDNVSKWVNAPAWVDNPNRHANHEAQRRAAYNKALALGDQLLVLVSAAPPPSPPGEDDFLMALSAEEQQEVLRAARNQLAQRKSRSPLRALDEGTVGDTDDQIWDMDSSIHLQVVFLAATLGIPSQLELLHQVAAADPVRYPDRQADRPIAQAILAEVTDNLELKRGILEALGRVTTAAPEVYTGEVLPARVVDIPAQTQSLNTPQDLLDTMERLKVFDNDYRDKFDDLTKGKK